MKLYNTLTRKVETIQPLNGKSYGIYSCGPTVYDHAHIGNLSAYIFADTLRRILGVAGKGENISVKHIMNYTDVDDKTIRRSQETYPKDEPHIALQKLTDTYIKIFLEDMQIIGNDIKPVTFIRATESIDAMQKLIRELYAQGFAYIADDGVYFSINAYKKSGKKYGQLLELSTENTSEARIQNDEYDKENIHDFVLWKAKKANEPSWDFEIEGHTVTGRPGWHIECSAMSERALGLPFDIHTGGVDLIFPHHENEIAQSTATRKDPVMAQFFAHNEHILVDGKKMSKSAQNFFTLKDIIDRGYDPLSFRLLVLQSLYRNPTNLTWEALEAAQNRLAGLQEFADLRFQGDPDALTVGNEYFTKQQELILEALKNDLDTPIALRIVSETITWVAKNGLHAKYTDGGANDFYDFIAFLDEVFGLSLLESKDITDEQKQLLKERDQARHKGDWTRADTIRDQLKKEGIGLRDKPLRAIWYRL